MKKALCIISAAILLAASLAAPSLASPAWSGDATGDGVINAKDVVAMMNHVVGADVSLAPTADYNGDGKVNAKDVTLTMKYLVGLPVLTDSLLEAKYGVSEPEFEVPDPVTDKEVFGGQFGFDPDAADNSAAFNSAAAYLRDNPGTKLTLETGVYRMGAASVPFDGVRDCVIDGAGSVLVYDAARYFTVRNCENLKFCALTVRWDWDAHPLASVAYVRSVVRHPDGSATAEFEFILDEDASYAMNEKWDSMMCVDPETYAMSIAVAGDIFYVDQNTTERTQIAPNVIRVTMKGTYGLPGQGRTMLIRHYNYGPYVFYTGAGSSNIVYEDINLYGNPGQGICARECSHHVRLTRVRITPDPERADKQFISTTADSVNIGDTNGYAVIEDCEFSFSGDDAVAVNDSMGVVHEVYGNELTMYTSGTGTFAVGDVIAFRRAGDFAPSALTATVTGKNADGKYITLILDRDAEDDVSENDFVLNTSHTSGNIIIRNCFFHESRARAIILGTRNCIVENCRIYRTQQQAILINVDVVADMWSIGKDTDNLIIRNNVFEKCDLFHGQNGNCLHFHTYSDFSESGVIGGECFCNILISGNRFIDPPGFAIKALGVRNLTVYGNTVEWPQSPFDGLSLVSCGQFRVLGQYYDDSRIFGNTWITSPLTPDDYKPISINPSKISTIDVEMNTVK